MAVTPEPLKTTAVAPVMLVPASRTSKPWPREPEEGPIFVITGRGGVTVNDWNGSEAAPALLTTTVRAPSAAPGSTVITIGRFVSVPPAATAPVTPLPPNATLAPCRFVPVMWAVTVDPWFPCVGLIAVIVGFGPVTKNPSNDSDDPDGVVRVTLRKSRAAVELIVIVTGADVAVPPAFTDPVTPVPLNCTPAAPERFVPVTVAFRTVPTAPDPGLIPVTAGADKMTSVVTVLGNVPDVEPLWVVANVREI